MHPLLIVCAVTFHAAVAISAFGAATLPSLSPLLHCNICQWRDRSALGAEAHSSSLAGVIHQKKLLGRGHDCLIHQYLKVLQDGSFLAPAVSTSHPLATAIIIATTVPRRNRPTCHRSCRCGLAFIGAVATAFILATSPPPPHVDHRRAADVQADVQAVVALAAPASGWFGRSRSPASWGYLASSALLEWALCSKYCQITHTCAQINILRVPHTHTPRANVRVVNRANRAPPGGGQRGAIAWTWSRGECCTRDTAHPARGAATPTPAGAHAV